MQLQGFPIDSYTFVYDNIRIAHEYALLFMTDKLMSAFLRKPQNSEL